MSMSMSMAVATVHLNLVLFIFVLSLANGLYYSVVRPNPANSCGSNFHRQLRTTHYLLALESFAAAMLLLAVRMVVDNAEAGAIAADRAAASAIGKAFDDAAAARGIASVPAGWKRQSLRELLSLAVILSAGASVGAILAFEQGFLYRTGCHAGLTADFDFDPILFYLVLVVHTFSGWVAEYQN